LGVPPERERSWTAALCEAREAHGCGGWTGRDSASLHHLPVWLIIIYVIQHAVVIHFGLEAHIVGIARSIYDEIVAIDVPGQNADPDKAEVIRSFVIPEHHVVPGSSSVRPRYINIFAAFLSDTKAWIICDFSRLVRLHIFSRDKPWQASDFQPTSRVSVVLHRC
jgi:hypothetical protein